MMESGGQQKTSLVQDVNEGQWLDNETDTKTNTETDTKTEPEVQEQVSEEENNTNTELHHVSDENEVAVVDEVEDEEVTKERVAKALELKLKGNTCFKEGDFAEALSLYTDAIEACPAKHPNQAPLYANRAACSQKMDDHEACVEDCTAALEIQPDYPKVIFRRAISEDKLEKFEDALEDYKQVVINEPSNHIALEACRRLPDQIKVKNEKLKDEMMGNLKKLGNMCLKPFGLSTNNFQMVQDPNTGGYSVNFKQ
eukprot:m.128065 g.128065  ORF g.128065 m.128065 type:complete len:255 (-) comp29311_c0_seq2:2222-2986(-)